MIKKTLIRYVGCTVLLFMMTGLVPTDVSGESVDSELKAFLRAAPASSWQEEKSSVDPILHLYFRNALLKIKADVNSYLKENPENPRAYFLLFLTQQELQEEESSIQALKKAIALNPVYREIVGRDEQKHTIANLRAIATACEAYAVDNNKYPAASNIQDLARIVSPKYIKRLPLLDSFGNPFRYIVQSDLQQYWIISGGADGKPDENVYANGFPSESAYGETSSIDDDIIFSDGELKRYPPQLKP